MRLTCAGYEFMACRDSSWLLPVTTLFNCVALPHWFKLTALLLKVMNSYTGVSPFILTLRFRVCVGPCPLFQACIKKNKSLPIRAAKCTSPEKCVDVAAIGRRQGTSFAFLSLVSLCMLWPAGTRSWDRRPYPRYQAPACSRLCNCLPLPQPQTTAKWR